MKDNNAELLPLVNEEGQVIGCATRGECHGGAKPLHPVVHLHLFNSEGELYLQHRPLWKDIQPGKWDTAVGGHLALGEDFETGAKRELAEELGITGVELFHIFDSKIRNDIESEDVRVFGAFAADGFKFDPVEIDEIRFWDRAALEDPENQSQFTPNLIEELKSLKLAGKFYPPAK